MTKYILILGWFFWTGNVALLVATIRRQQRLSRLTVFSFLMSSFGVSMVTFAAMH